MLFDRLVRKAWPLLFLCMIKTNRFQRCVFAQSVRRSLTWSRGSLNPLLVPWEFATVERTAPAILSWPLSSIIVSIVLLLLLLLLLLFVLKFDRKTLADSYVFSLLLVLKFFLQHFVSNFCLGLGPSIPMPWNPIVRLQILQVHNHELDTGRHLTLKIL